MISKFSVKKPLTIFVAVVAVIILGIVAFTKMTPDLLPNINLPYAIVMTTYPGASPEEVESVVTKPVEKTLSTLDKIDTVTSQSGENFSLVILQFADDANMDVITSDIREKLDLVTGYWDDSIGTPTILKLNPNMMPIMVASVDREDTDVIQLTDFLNDTLLNELEGTQGVASISTMGMIEEGVHVILNQDKINKANKKLQNAIDGNFADAEQELADGKAGIEDGQNEVESGKSKIESGKSEITSGQQQAASEFAKAENEINDKKDELVAAKQMLDAQIMILDTTITQLQSVKDQLDPLVTGIEELEQAQQNAQSQLEELQAQKVACEEAKAGFDAQIQAIQENADLTDEEKQLQIDAIQTSPEYLENETDLATATAAIPAKEAELTQIQAQLDGIDAQLAAMGMTREDIGSVLEETSAGLEEAEASKAEIDETKQQMESGLVSINDALVQLETQKSTANFQMSGALAQMIAGETALGSTEAQLKAAKEQMEDGEKQLEDAKKAAKDGADLNDTITMDMISQILTAQSFSMPAGYATAENEQKVLVRVGDKVADQAELETLMLFDPGIDGASPVYLKDVADIVHVDTSDSTYARINGNDGMILTFSKQSNYATAQVSNNLADRFEELSRKYEGLHFTALMDQGDYIYFIVNSVLENLLFGAVLAIIILIFFLKDWRPTLIIACSIPVSVIFAIVLMYFSGVTLNIISLSGLAVGVGMLVDNSVVVIENIYRLRNKGVSVFKAAVHGASQVAGAITASTLTTICVFLPIVFVEGLTRDLFTDMALTIGYSLVASLIVALTLVPAMSSGMLRKEKQIKHKFFDKFLALYERTIRFTLKHRALVLIVSVVLMVASVPLSLSRGFSFMPAMESAQVEVTVQMPDDYQLEDTTKTSDEIIGRIQELEGVNTVGAMLSSNSSMMGGMGMSMGDSGEADVTSVMMYVLLDDGYSSGAVSKQITKACEDLDCTITASGSMDMTSMMSGMSGSGVSLKLYGDDLDLLRETAESIGKTLEGVDGIDTVDDGLEETTPELRITVDKNKAMAKGLTVAQVYQEMAKALKDETTSISLSMGSVDADVIVINQEAKERTPDSIEAYKFSVKDKEGEEETFRLSEIAKVENTESLSSISRDSQRRYITISATLKDGYNVSLVTQAAQQELKSVTLPEGSSIEYAGENETIMESMVELVKMMLLAIAIIYLIMVAQFQSFKSPFIVMFTIPLAFTGGLLALFVCGFDVSVIAMIGFVMLAGIIVNNGIVLVDYVNQLRAEGVEKREALVEAGKTRMRPILMTALTTVLGLSVMAVGTGMGSELMQPIAIVCIGGLIYATIMTLYVVPVMYDFLNRKELHIIKDEDLELTEE